MRALVNIIWLVFQGLLVILTFALVLVGIFTRFVVAIVWRPAPVALKLLCVDDIAKCPPAVVLASEVAFLGLLGMPEEELDSPTRASR